MNSHSRADLHLYTRHSMRAADWVMRRLEFPASYSDPRDLYGQLRERGMDFVTFTDQNTIAGCREIVDLPGVFLSEEVSTVFPEDGAKASVLVYGITESQHAEIQAARENVYDLQRYLAEHGIAHAVALPFHALNEELTPLHFQKLALLFRHFEALNGRYAARLSETARFALGGLCPHDIERFVAVTGIEPTHDEPWRKVLIGGSDDHSSLHAARAWTETPRTETAADFLGHVRDGRCEAKGEPGNPLAMAHGTYRVAFQFAKARFALRSEDPGVGLIEKMFSRFMEGQDPTEFTFAEKLGFLAQGIVTGKIFELTKPGNASIWKELSGYFSQPEVKAALASAATGAPEAERRAFLMANLIANQLGFRFFTQFIAQITSGKFIESIQTISPLVPIVALLGPYIHAYRQPKRHWLRAVSVALCERVPEALENRKRAWFTDTLEDVNGVATTIRRMTAAAVAGGHDVTVVVSRSEIEDQGIPLKNFPPVGEFELPEYELQRLSFPPVLPIVDYVARENFGEVIISTPGPVGLVALFAAKLLGLRTSGIYHTDFPQYVRILTDDAFMETLTWNYMHWFYSQLDVLYVNSEEYRRVWIERGIPAAKLRLLPRGLDIRMFHPSRRDEGFWRERGLREEELGMLYVGRVSKEKNLDVLVAVSKRLAQAGRAVRPLVVGEGPYLQEMKRLLPDAIFTGYLRGEELARAYASADFFVFPSTTDTFGNVVIEAQASGIPVIVSDAGGPRDLVEHGRNGFVTHALDAEDLAGRVSALCQDASLRERMGGAARQRVEDRDWADAAERFWAVSPE
jgi:glycosyltransferase involved in cell wall biosynthesis